MLYRIFHVIVKFSLRIYFRKIDLFGLEHLKPGKAQILASNHPSGFLEPIIMACFFPRSLYFLVRGDLFENKFLRPILLGTHQLPIYRFKDGFSKLRENKSSLQAASQVLLLKKCILIFVEGSTKSIKMVRPLHRGFLRLALDAQLVDPNLEIEILPVGINFSDSSRFKSEVMIRVDKPILIDSQKILSPNNDPAKYSVNLLDEVYHSLKNNVIHLSDQSRLKVMEDMFIMAKAKHNRPPYPRVLYSDDFLLISKQIGEKLDSLEVEPYTELKQSIVDLKKNIKSDGYHFEDITKSSPGFLQYFIVILGFIPALAGFLFHAVPLGLAYYFVRLKIKNKEFYGAVWFAGTIVVVIVYYVILFTLVAFGLIPFFVVILFILTGYFSQYYYDIWNSWFWWNKKRWIKNKEAAILLYNQYMA